MSTRRGAGRLRCGVLGLVVVSAVALHGSGGHTRAQTRTDSFRLTLSSHTVWQGEQGWCVLSADVAQDRGLSASCGNTGPLGAVSPKAGDSAIRRRSLTALETATLRKLYDAADLFEGGYLGRDLSGSDLPFVILIVRSLPDQRAAALVVTGNPTFSQDPRKALLDWLLRERQAMLR